MRELLILTITLSAPLILAAMGGFTSERGGVINIGLEGLMLMAACMTALGSASYGPWAGLASGIAAAIVLSMVHWLVTQIFHVDHVISGMSINALAAGGTNFLFGHFSDPSHAGMIPGLGIRAYLWIAFLLPGALWLYVRKTRGGIRLVAVGADPDKARLVGIEPLRIRLFGLLATGVFTGLAGAMLVTDTGVFTDNMTAGRGYIALAALILGGWRPVQAFLACVAFGFFSALQVQLQGTAFLGAQLPSQFWSAVPYLVTIIALAGLLGRSRVPAGLGRS